jgi:hypothetical protein
LVSGPKQPGDRIDVYLRPLVDDLKILWKPSVLEVWDEFTSLARVKGKLQLAHTSWKILEQYG